MVLNQLHQTMKKFLLLGLLFISGHAMAQITLEHHYDSNIVFRVKLGLSGEKYYVHNRVNNQLDFFNSDHSLWKSINIPIPAEADFTGISHVSDNMINNDDNIEVAYSVFQNGDVGGTYNSYIISEDGTVLLEVPNCNYLLVDQTPGLAPKMISQGYQKNVYSLPGLALEQSFAITNILTRTVLETSGEKYYYLDVPTGQVKFYNPDYSLWKTVAVPKPSDATYQSISFVSETSVNPDAALEIAYAYHRLDPGYVRTSMLVSENGNVLLALNDNNGLRLSKIDGLPAKLMSHKAGVTVYGLPSLTVEHVYGQRLERTVLDVSGEKYYETNEHQLLIYNNDHSLWKTINLHAPDEMYQIHNVTSITEHQFDDDNQVEVVYTMSNDVLFGMSSESYVAKENGELLLTVPQASFLYLSEITGLDKKLIAGFSRSDDSDTGPVGYAGEVYRVDRMMSASGFENDARAMLYPNPARSLLNINAKLQITQITIYNILGIPVKQQNGRDLKQMNIEGLATGHYLVKLMDTNQKESTHKILVSN